ncbi:MAG: uL13 family ribosomal protein, partial [Gemmatimonadales bacterium]
DFVLYNSHGRVQPNAMGTYAPKGGHRDPHWFLVDAEGERLGRLATVVATRLRGKHRPTFAPNHDHGDHVIVVNAANKEKVWEHILAKRSGIQARVKDASDAMGLLAVQGPNAEELLASLGADVATSLRYYYFAPSSVAGTNVIVSRTGYTGEDGFEIFCRPEQAEVLWHALVGKGRGTPCGLAARDSLRLEMGYPLYGNDIDETVNPYEVRLGWIVKLDKGAPFNGLTALQRIKARGVERKLVGFRCADKGAIPRPGYEVFLGDRKVDIVRSGGFSPSLGVGIGTTLLPSHSTDPGTEIEIDSRGKKLKGEVVALPFYQDGTAKKS